MREKETEQLKRFTGNQIKLVRIISDQAIKFIADSYGTVTPDVYIGMQAVLNVVVVNCAKWIEEFAEEIINDFIDKDFGDENV